MSHWEVVGKGKKGGKAPALSKNQKKKFTDNMPRIEANAPLDPDETIYTMAFAEREALNSRPTNGHANGHAVNGSVNAAKKMTLKKKKPDQEPKKNEKPIPVDDALAKVDAVELETMLKQSQMRFPDNQAVWLKDLASYLNMKLENTQSSHPVFKGKPSGYPLCQLPKNCTKLLNSVVQSFSSQSLEHVYLHTMHTMVQDVAKDQPVLGYKLFLQFLAQHKPDLSLAKIHSYLELARLHQNRPSACLAVLWAVGQCGQKSFKCGLKVWLDLMLPCLEIKQVAHYPVDYIQALLSSNKNLSGALGVVTLKEYFQVLEVVFAPTFTLAPDLKARLLQVYPSIKRLAWGESPSHSLRTLFPTYLAGLAQQPNKALTAELLECLVECLARDTHSYSVWCQLYTKHLAASGVLLEYLADNWPSLGSKVNRKLLAEAARSFSLTNEEMDQQGRGCEAAHATAATKELQGKMAATSLPWGTLLLGLGLALAAMVALDLAASPSLQGKARQRLISKLSSRSVRFLEHYGVQGVLSQAAARISSALNVVASWLSSVCPVYYVYLRDTAGPALRSGVNSAGDMLLQVEEATRPHRAALGERAALLGRWIHDLAPDAWATAGELLVLWWETACDYSLWLWKATLSLADQAQTNMGEVCKRENLRAGFIWLANTVREGVAATSAYVQGLIQ